MANPSLDRELCKPHRLGFMHFVRIAWPHIEPAPLVVEPHLELLAANLQGALLHPTRMDAVYNVPPGTSKSSVASVLFHPWSWTVDPKLKFMHTGFDESLQLRFAERSMNLIMSEWFQERWPELTILKGERASVGFYENAQGGLRFSTMMGGKATGRHANILMIDDPHKPDDLSGDPESVKSELDLAWTRFIETFSRRTADAATFKRICIMQRLHVEDIAGRMLQKPGTVHLRLPMKYEPEWHCSTPWGADWRTEAGELLCPGRFPADVVAETEVQMTARAFASQYQQRPTPAQGALFQREWFSRRHATPPNGCRFIMSVDSSLKEGKDSDYFVAQVWAAKGAADFYLVDQVRARMSFSDSVRAIKELKRKWPNIGNILIELKSNGDAIVDTLRRQIPGVLGVYPEGGKMARMHAIEPFLRAGNVSFPDAKWMEGFVEECIAAPVGAHDDQPDCMSQALIWLTGKSRSAIFKAAMANVRAGKTGVR